MRRPQRTGRRSAGRQRGCAGALVDHRSDEAETRRAFELGGGPPCVGHGQGRERPEPRGVSSDRFGGDVVGPHGERQRVGRVERLRAGRASDRICTSMPWASVSRDPGGTVTA